MPTDLLLTDRTRETRDKLLRVARDVFEEDGFDGASISRIVEGANVSRGTFYLYFESKEDIFRTLAEDLLAQVVRLQTPLDRLAPIDTIRGSIAGFIGYYREHARLMAVLEQVATHDVEFVAQVAHEVVVMAGGEVVSAGPVGRVLAESPAFAPQMSKILGEGWLTVEQVRAALV